MLGSWTRPTTYVKMSCPRSNDSKLFHLQVQGEGSRHAPTTSLHRGWVVWTNVGPVGTGTRGRPAEVRAGHQLACRRRSSGGHNSLALKCINDFIAPSAMGRRDLSIGTLVYSFYYILMRSNELRALRRLPAASMLPAGSRRAAPEPSGTNATLLDVPWELT